ncbi:MAG: peptidoglycan DD-metalloendopeptidase family protein, partial [Deltaproteobacteria bacterium]|nr:peptidoglycan DD-metalloendopeptidase family protein [Deltaproteobacteria bacterium]
MKVIIKFFLNLFFLTLITFFSIILSLHSQNVFAQNHSSNQNIASQLLPDPFIAYLDADIPIADGFDFSLGDANGEGEYTDLKTKKTYKGYYIATKYTEVTSLGIHPGEDFNGSGGGNTDLGQPIHAVAAGRVIAAANMGALWGNVITVEHLFYENHEKKKIQSVYAHVNEIKVKPGQKITRRQIIGTVGQDPDKKYYAHLHLELRWDLSLAPTFWPSAAKKNQQWVEQHYAPPSEFIKAHRQLFIPQNEATLLLVDHDCYRMQLYQHGKFNKEYPISFGQGQGRKRQRGDNKTPMGMYFVILKNRGFFAGDYGAYYGGHWIKINYPNTYDAKWGVENGLITNEQQAKIAQAWSQRQATLGNTKLGGGIGFHGWIDNWDLKGPRHLSWGCIVMQ